MSAAAALARLQPLKGQTLGYSRWITVDQSMIDSFASVTHDDQWIHVDAESAQSVKHRSEVQLRTGS